MDIFFGFFFFYITRKNFKSILALLLRVLVLKYKALFFLML